jgi:flagellar hook-associated protein 1 FlgK
MSGLGLVLEIAKEALLTQKYAIDVASHNIANVNTPGYTRQTAVLQAKDAAPLGGVMLGRGVTIQSVIQITDSFIEISLRDRNSNLSALTEKETYMSSMEAIFNESSDQSLSTQLTHFWNAWQDLANNPSGMSERSILFERGSLLTERLQSVYSDMNQMLDQIGNTITAGIDRINALLSNIADLNQQIVQTQGVGNPNDLRDQRSQALNQLAQYIDVKSFESGDGSITVTTGRGYVLISKADAYSLKLEGNDIKWIGSGTSKVNITDTITGGKLGGWLDMRDKIIPEYKADMDSFANELIWQINSFHSQGAGTEGFSAVTSAYTVADPAQPLGTAASGLAYSGHVSNGSLNVVVYDLSNPLNPPTVTNIPVNAAGTTLNNLTDALSAVLGVALPIPPVSGGKLTISAAAGYSFAFSSDTSNVLAALGINTFFTGSGANDIGMNSLLGTNKGLIAAGRLGAAGEMAAGDNSNALAIDALQSKSVGIHQWTYNRGSSPVNSVQTGTLDSYLHSFIGSVGIDSQTISRSKDFDQTIVEALRTRRDNISAVSLDEEMTSLIQYQQAYSAAAKLVSMASEMFQTLLDAV